MIHAYFLHHLPASLCNAHTVTPDCLWTKSRRISLRSNEDISSIGGVQSSTTQVVRYFGSRLFLLINNTLIVSKKMKKRQSASAPDCLWSRSSTIHWSTSFMLNGALLILVPANHARLSLDEVAHNLLKHIFFDYLPSQVVKGHQLRQLSSDVIAQ